MAWNPNFDGFIEHLRSLELTTLHEGTVLYRGSFEGRPNEDWAKPSLRGVKYFTPDVDYACRYARRKYDDSYIKPPEGTKGLLFRVELNYTCKVLVFPEVAKVYAQFVQNPRPQLGERFDLFGFERNELMPIMRKAQGTDISGYIVPSDRTEVLLDLNNTKVQVSLMDTFQD
ncbi:MAG: hypothetical protein PXX77_11275 [Gallionella sp.]|nr:hypothetical protein [Gallionella sp.]